MRLSYPFSDASEAVVEHLLLVLYNLIRLRLVRHTEQSRLHLGGSLEIRFGKDRLDVVAESQVVDEVRVSHGLVVVLETTEFRVEQVEVTEVERTPELSLAHASSAGLVVVTCPFVNTNSRAEHLPFTERSEGVLFSVLSVCVMSVCLVRNQSRFMRPLVGWIRSLAAG